MAINPALLISAAVLQDYLVDKDTGFPLANGIISLYEDTSRSIYKNWYYQTGVPGAYTWIPLDNPLHLSSAGTIQDPNGNDVIPFYYPYDENDETIRQPYYITVYASDEFGNPTTLQFTRENFPFNGNGISPTSQTPTLRNYILNNVYWRNIGEINVTSETDIIICPSQHDGYTNGDIRFIKNVSGANDNISFLPMTQLLADDITPEYYLNFVCTASQAGETVKCIQYPVSLHIETLESVEATFTFHAQNLGGSPNNFLDVFVYQFLGTGAISQPEPILIKRFFLSGSWQKYTEPFTFPASEGLVLGPGGDDALFIRIQYPESVTFEINHTKPQVYLSSTIPDNDFDTYDQIETIINSPRTGDTRISLNDSYPWGWIAANDQTIGNSASNAGRANADTWPLYNLIWSKVSNVSLVLAPLYNSDGSPALIGFNAIDDWKLNKQLALTKILGQVLAGTVPPSAIPMPQDYTADFTTAQFSVINSTQFSTGVPVILNNTGGAPPAGLSLSTIYYAIYITSTRIALARTLNDAINFVYIAFSDNGSGTNSISVYSDVLGVFEGEKSHIQSASEVGVHVHPPLPPQTLIAGEFPAGTGGYNFSGGNNDGSRPTTGPNAGGAPFNIVQPTTFLNIYLKL